MFWSHWAPITGDSDHLCWEQPPGTASPPLKAWKTCLCGVPEVFKSQGAPANGGEWTFYACSPVDGLSSQAIFDNSFPVMWQSWQVPVTMPPCPNLTSVTQTWLCRILPRWKQFEGQHTALRSILFSALAGFDIHYPLFCWADLYLGNHSNRLNRIMLSSSPLYPGMADLHPGHPFLFICSPTYQCLLSVSTLWKPALPPGSPATATDAGTWNQGVSEAAPCLCPRASYGSGPVRLCTTWPLLTMGSLGLWWP